MKFGDRDFSRYANAPQVGFSMKVPDGFEFEPSPRPFWQEYHVYRWMCSSWVPTLKVVAANAEDAVSTAASKSKERNVRWLAVPAAECTYFDEESFQPPRPPKRTILRRVVPARWTH